MSQEDDAFGLGDPRPRFIWHSFYAEVARRHLAEVEEMFSRRNEIRAVMPDSEIACYEQCEELDPIDAAIDEKAISAIVFAGMALEAYIYDYGARKVGEAMVEQHLDRMSLLDKWVTYPLIATGKPFPKDRQGYELLKKLVKSRNALVHARSKLIVLSELPDGFEDRNKQELVEAARAAIQAMEAVAEDFLQIDPKEPTAWFLRSPTAATGSSD